MTREVVTHVAKFATLRASHKQHHVLRLVSNLVDVTAPPDYEIVCTAPDADTAEEVAKAMQAQHDRTLL